MRNYKIGKLTMSVEMFDKIEEYLSGGMSGSDKVSFEEELNSNPKLQEQLRLQEVTNEAILEGKMLDVRSKINSIHLKNTQTVGSMSSKSTLAIALISATIVGVGAWVLFPKEKENVVIEEFEQSKDPVLEPVEEHTAEEEITTVLEVSIPKKVEESINKEIVSENQHIESKEVIPTKAEPKKVVVDVCNSVEIGTELEIIPTCIGAKRGGIFVNPEKTTGGRSPYSYSIDGDNFQTEGKFVHLSSGKYSFYIKDDNGCIVKKTDWVRIQSTSCK